MGSSLHADATPAQTTPTRGAQPPIYGATPKRWAHWRQAAYRDLLPVVSNPTARISKKSKLKQLGKTPSTYNTLFEVAGIADWTSHQATAQQLAKWQQQPDYGICLILGRGYIALDIDIDHAEQASAVKDTIEALTGALSIRGRNNSAKALYLFRIDGELPKRRMPTQHGFIELLATGQQCIVEGTHPSGRRYEWSGLPDAPTITADTLDAVWSSLDMLYGTEQATEHGKTKTRSQANSEAVAADGIAQSLIGLGISLSSNRDGSLNITCPFEDEHTGESAESSTTYFPAHTGGYARGHFVCLHAHCAHRTDDDFLLKILGIGDTAAELAELADEQNSEPAKHEEPKRPRFVFEPAHVFASRPPPEWIVQDVIPSAELVQVVGPPGSGKSFWVTDLVAHIAQGKSWRGKQVKQGDVAYIVAEGAGGFRNRLKALELDLPSLRMSILADAPNMLDNAQMRELLDAVGLNPPKILVIDTAARVTAGANENSSEDMGKLIAHCKLFHRTHGATVILVHHSGKDVERGARGWSGLFGACDTEIMISREGDERFATVTKQKDGDDGQVFGFALNIVEVARDAADLPITSCVVVQNEAVPALPSASNYARSNGKGSLQQLIMRVLPQIAELGACNPSLAILIDSVVNELPFDESGGRDRRRERVCKAIEQLSMQELVTVSGGFVQINAGSGGNES